MNHDSDPQEAPPIVNDIDALEHPEITKIAMAICKEKIEKGSKMKLPLPVGQMAKLYSLYDLIDQCGDTARDHGFWEAHVDQALKVCNIPRNLYDAVVRLRFTNSKTMSEADKDLIMAHSEELTQTCIAIKKMGETELLGDPSIFLALISTEAGEAMEAARAGNWDKPSGVWEELADVLIRCFDFIARYGPKRGMMPSKFIQIIQAKMAVNESRPVRHGKAY